MLSISIRRLASGVRRTLIPDRCALCCLPGIDGWFCERCLNLLPSNAVACERCATPLALIADLPLCAACRTNPPVFSATRAPMLYEFPLDSALKALKFRRSLHHAPALSSLLLGELRECFSDCDALVPVPLHRWRHAARGFNQAEELCRPLSRATGLPILRGVRRVRATRTQSELPARERRGNVRGAFAVRGPLRSRRPLIVDDVMTTGETCNQLARVLLYAGADDVRVLVVARA